MRAELLSAILEELNGSSADIEASAVLSTDGLVMAAQLPPALEEDRVGAMSAALVSLGERTARELARGELEQVLVKGRLGYVLMAHAGPEAILTVLCTPTVRLGLVLLDLRRAADSIERVL
ncbi:MAG: roadblock/LC7 domain-containing protein [Burkholderiales bacterium]